ncbi:MAG: hypothetical protein H6851_07055 [Geminicoccaceae bacterium]|nr:hypothetical protein [Geminicoccaceae bacterium]
MSASDSLSDRQGAGCGYLTRRAALTMVGAGVPAAAWLGTSSPASSSPLAQLGRELVQAMDEYEWWNERALQIDSAIPSDLSERLSPGDDAAKAAVDEWCRLNGLDHAESKASEALKRQWAASRGICAEVATDLAGLMVQAQALATRTVYFDPELLPRLMDGFILGLGFLGPTVAHHAASDARLISTCDAWHAALDEVRSALRAVDEIDIPDWARGVLWVSDPELHRAIINEQDRTGYRAARERSHATWERVEPIEDVVPLMTASSVSGLRAQASTLMHEFHFLGKRHPSHFVASRTGMALVRGLERLGARRTVDLHEWWETEADDPPIPIQ